MKGGSSLKYQYALYLVDEQHQRPPDIEKHSKNTYLYYNLTTI